MTRLSKLSRSIAGKVAIVTGAASGMGRATAHLFADEGAHVAVTDINAEGVEAVVAEMTEAGLSAKGWTLDLANLERIKIVIAEVADHFGGIDILVNNAGISKHTLIDDDEYEDIWDRHLDILLRAHTRTIRAALPYLRKSEGGRIVNIASVAGKKGNPNAPAYSSAKAGVIGLTKTLGKELAKTGIVVNCVAPAAVQTAIFDQMSDEHVDFMLSKIPMKRFGVSEEIAAMVAWLCSEECSFSTGAIFDISGGRATY